MPISRLSILGLGLLGASLARAVRQHRPDCQITAYDRNGVNPGAIDVFARSPAQASEGADCVILCVPPNAVAPLFAAIAPTLSPRTVVTDVTSIKQSVVEAANALPCPARFVGGHPMAGGERSGSGAARADLFAGATVVLTPVEITDPDAILQVESFWKDLGAVPLRLSPSEHDRRVARISHLPHILASALIHLSDADSRSIAGTGFRDMTRIAAGDAALWRQILLGNRDELRALLPGFIRQLESLDRMLDPDRADELERWLARAASVRSEI